MAIVNELANEGLGRSIHELPPQTQSFLEQLHVNVGRMCQEHHVERPALWFGRRAILDWTHLSMTQVRKHLSRLLDYEYVLAHRARNGESYEYELQYNGEAEKRERFMMGLIDVERLREEESTCSTGDPAPLGGHLAPPLPPGCPPVARGLPPRGVGRNGKQDTGSSGSGPISPKNAEGPTPEGNPGRSRKGNGGR